MQLVLSKFVSNRRSIRVIWFVFCFFFCLYFYINRCSYLWLFLLSSRLSAYFCPHCACLGLFLSPHHHHLRVSRPFLPLCPSHHHFLLSAHTTTSFFPAVVIRALSETPVRLSVAVTFLSLGLGLSCYPSQSFCLPPPARYPFQRFCLSPPLIHLSASVFLLPLIRLSASIFPPSPYPSLSLCLLPLSISHPLSFPLIRLSTSVFPPPLSVSRNLSSPLPISFSAFVSAALTCPSLSPCLVSVKSFPKFFAI